MDSKNVDVTQMLRPIDDESSNGELEMCQCFLEDAEMESGRHRVFNFAMEILDAHTLSQKPDTVFEKLRCTAKLNVAFGFVLKKVDDRTCRHYYAHENNILMELSKLVATQEELVQIKIVLGNTDVTETCTKERATTKWKIYKFRSGTVFDALIRKVPMRFKDAVLPESHTKNLTVIFLTFLT